MIRNDRTASRRRPSRRAAVAALTMSALLAVSSFASGQPTTDPVAARTLFAEGRKLVSSGQYARACPKFEESLKLDPGIGTSFNLADCWQHIGRTATAWAQFLDVAAQAKSAGQVDRERVARSRAAALEPRLSRLVVRVESTDPQLEIRRDDVLVSRALFGASNPVDPGSHVIEAKAPAKKPWRTVVQIAEGGATVTVTVPQLEADAASNAAQRPADGEPARGTQRTTPASTSGPATDLGSTEPSESNGGRAAAFIAGGMGLVGIGVGSVFAALSKSADNAANGLCTGGAEKNTCSDLPERVAYDEHAGRAKTNAQLAYGGFALGAAGLATAAVLFLISKPKTAASAPNVTPLVGQSTLGVGLVGSW